MPDAAKQTLERNLVELYWNNKDSAFDTKSFIQKAKDILTPYVTSDDDLLRKLREFLEDGGPHSTSIDAIVFENLPVDPYVPPTPTAKSVKSLNKPTYISEAMLMAMGELAETYTVGYKSETEYSNSWAHEGFPRPGTGGSALTSTAGMLNHHQECPTDLLGLICLREGDNPNLKTTLISIENIIQLLPKHVVSILRQNRFKINASDGGRMDEGAVKKKSAFRRDIAPSDIAPSSCLLGKYGWSRSRGNASYRKLATSISGCKALRSSSSRWRNGTLQ